MARKGPLRCKQEQDGRKEKEAACLAPIHKNLLHFYSVCRKMERKRGGMMWTNQSDKISFWRGKDIYLFMNVRPHRPNTSKNSGGIRI